VHQAYYRVMRAKTAAARKEAEGELQAILARRAKADAQFGEIALQATKGDVALAQEMLEGTVSESFDATCHKAALEDTVKSCGALNDYSLRYGRLSQTFAPAEWSRSPSLQQSRRRAARRSSFDRPALRALYLESEHLLLDQLRRSRSSAAAI